MVGAGTEVLRAAQDSEKATESHEKLPADFIGGTIFHYIDFSFINCPMILHYYRISDPWGKTMLNPIVIKRFTDELQIYRMTG